MNYVIWVKGLFMRNSIRMWGAIVGVALTVALLVSLGAFITSSDSVMTDRAVKDVPVDWQIQLSHSSDKDKVIKAVEATNSYHSLSQVFYASASGFSAAAGGTTQTTGTGQVLGVSPEYSRLFPSQIRSLLGSTDGVLIAQQTAANLHVSVGDHVTIKRVGLPPVKVKIDGVIDLPNADSLFQAVGVPSNAAPQAPPDNVLLLPTSQWHQIFDQQMNIRPDSVKTQLHLTIPHNLPPDPTAAYVYVQQLANHVEALISGSGIVGNNLAARLDGVREDALYARILILFLGLPGAILAALLTIYIAASGSQLRREQQALLRTRGASVAQVLKFAIVEAVWVGIVGVIAGLVLSIFTSKSITGAAWIYNTATIIWIVLAAVAGFLLSIFSILSPAWKDAKYSTVVSAKAIVGRKTKPVWGRIYLDLILLLISALSFANSANSGYQLVLAPEGVAQTSVHYEAFIAPFCLWLGGTLLFIRLLTLALDKGGNILSNIFKPVAHNLSHVVSSSFSRQRKLLVRGIILVSLSFSFAASTAVFNTTYNAQALVDAQLTNGADVTVSGPTAANPASKLNELSKLNGALNIQPMQHRFAYVGNDLQDLFGIDARHVNEATHISNAYFANGDAKASLAKLAQERDGIFVSAETATDYQLQPGDQLNLRLQGRDHQYHVIPFRFVGVVREFPTAPKDSFLVANADYVAEKTGVGAYETLLIHCNTAPEQFASQARKVVAGLPGVKVTEINSTQRTISTSLTSINLHGLTSLELAFSILFIAGATGLVFALGMNERRRIYSILTAIGAKRDQLGAFLWSEGLLVLIGGGVIGLSFGMLIAELLVKVLNGVFDPPPEFLQIPWGYLLTLIVTGFLFMIIVVLGMIKYSRQGLSQSLRSL
ncbi:ABC transporter permease [Aneurinibacillus sp. Ricciae_BoGa-3]|uniref:ABC transporter permease n=1 Tax=Aneurinibacillus sp. Ricciae_BoGa-3 TaxID=3022697 RepID=UPI0023408EDD|nr:ABC transporter permease [Aneurinibacillus sp. Ricciae_BoGa-3]WCK52549.1 ABC transporter permease [Aneurinibacillus sp. Ricciae_BoGa-3]